jgi:hypothetical protein
MPIAASTFYDFDTNGVERRWDHLQQLTEAANRVARAMARAKASRTDAP